MSRKTISILIAVLLGLGVIGFAIYKHQFPSGPILNDVPNPVSDKATTSKDFDESTVPTNTLRNAYFGDLHVHTNYSFDAYIGSTRVNPDQAYQFAKGEVIEILGVKGKISRPLDFAAVTDHSEFLGEVHTIRRPEAAAHNAYVPRLIRGLGTDTVKMLQVFINRMRQTTSKKPRGHLKFFRGFETTKTAWLEQVETAEQHYEPGQFTTFAAYEWTLGISGAHLHRNIFFRDMKVPDYPISSLEARTPEDMWTYLEDISKQGATVMAIPHNTNLSGGMAFTNVDKNGNPIDSKYATRSHKWEPLVEIHQAKGNSEVYAPLWQNDEFADFENYEQAPVKKTSYVRYALKKGLEHQEKLGVNPYKYGLIGSTDTHSGTPGNTEEADTFLSNHAALDLYAHNRRKNRWALNLKKNPYQTINPGGLIGVWAEANTRGHLFDAMQRKETFATSGGRILVRFFAGYDFDGSYNSIDDLVKDGYAKGVPMGGDIQLKNGKAPSFLIWATKDAESANLDRIQVIKGWYKDGELHEKIYNVALSDNRKVNTDGSVPDNGATVNMETGAWSKDKGAIELQTVWTDPEFDAEVNAFYYLRVLELPTASYRLWDQIRYGIEFPEGTDLIIRERAWSSPIWYEKE